MSDKKSSTTIVCHMPGEHNMFLFVVYQEQGEKRADVYWSMHEIWQATRSSDNQNFITDASFSGGMDCLLRSRNTIREFLAITLRSTLFGIPVWISILEPYYEYTVLVQLVVLLYTYILFIAVKSHEIDFLTEGAWKQFVRHHTSNYSASTLQREGGSIWNHPLPQTPC